jgi:hypothetical protein
MDPERRGGRKLGEGHRAALAHLPKGDAVRSDPRDDFLMAMSIVVTLVVIGVGAYFYATWQCLPC